ncbi:MAG: hypothetical protein HYT65_00475 [Candidatus Yanofskybacteria bacterium]|nr:hypothetical protein [Candidatus Yanofskybacteria bacterium]
MNRKFIIKSLLIVYVILIVSIVLFVIPPKALAHPTQYGEWSGSDSSSAGGLQTVPDGFGLTAIAYGSDDDRCSVFIRTAPVDANGIINFGAVSGYRTAICNSGGGDDGNPGPRVEPITDHYATGWTWGANTGGGRSGDSSFPPSECYYQEYAPLTDINNRSGWGAPFDGTCNERSYQSGWIRGRIAAPPGQVIVAVGISLANDANVSMVGMNTSHAPFPQGTISADPNPIQVCSPDTTGVTTLSVSASVGWDIRIGSPTGSIFVSGGAGNISTPTGDWVTNGMTFYLLEGGTTNVLDSIVATHTMSGCPNTLTVTSTNPTSGVAMTGVTTDINSRGNGSTQFTRTYNFSTAVSITAPATASGNNFSSWSGCDGVTGTTCSITMNADRTITANYIRPSALSGSISADPNPIQVCPPDTTGATTLSGSTNTNWDIRIDSPTGTLFASGGAGNYSELTGDWVTNGMTFYLLEGGTANVLNSIVVTHTTSGCPLPPPVVGADLDLSPDPMNLSTTNKPSDDFDLTFSGVAAGISVDGVTGSITVGIGTNITYAWSSYNASSGKAALQIKDPSGNNVSSDPCGNPTNDPWPFISGTSGSLSGSIDECQAGYSYVITYTAENTMLQSNFDTITIRVSVPTANLSINKTNFNLGDDVPALITLQMPAAVSIGRAHSILPILSVLGRNGLL